MEITFNAKRQIEETIKDYGKIEFTFVDSETHKDENITVVTDNYEEAIAEVQHYMWSGEVYI